MSIPKALIKTLLNPKTYIWVDAFLLKETQKAILIIFDSRKIWLPKAWIVRIKHNLYLGTVKIKISQYHWEKNLKKYLTFNSLMIFCYNRMLTSYKK